MTNLDQFESAFRSAAKPVFHPADIEIKTVAIVCDRVGEEATAFFDAAKLLLRATGPADAITWECIDGAAAASPGALLEHIQKLGPQLLCTYRNLHSDGYKWPHSLGEHLDVLTQVAQVPTLVCPHPALVEPSSFAEQGTERVMAVTDHLAGDDALVNWAVKIAANDGLLLLTHVEDQTTYDRTIDVISKIPALNTDVARDKISEQLLKEPHDYIRSCRERLEAAGAHVKIEEIVTMGHRVADYKRLVSKHRVDVLVLHTRDEDQMAMHGLAYPIAVELRDIPLLLI